MEKDEGKKAHRLLDYLLTTYRLKNDSILADVLEVKKPTISKIRNGHMGVGAAFILAVHDAFEIPIKRIKELVAEGK